MTAVFCPKNARYEIYQEFLNKLFGDGEPSQEPRGLALSSGAPPRPPGLHFVKS